MTVGIVLCFMNKQVVNDSWLIISVKQKLTDQFKKNWESISNDLQKVEIY